LKLAAAASRGSALHVHARLHRNHLVALPFTRTAPRASQAAAGCLSAARAKCNDG
jgi:hypothetical protein